MPKGGEIFVLKMPVVRLRDLVDVVVEETCRKYGVPVGEVRREEIGLRFGEKMFEELMTVEESKFGFELPEMYAICQAYFAFWGKKGISPLAGLPAAEVRSYSSQDQEPIDKEAVRRIILAEKLI